MVNEPIIEMHHIFKTYPSQISALSDITLEIFPGEFTFITGPSGSGKSALFRILLCSEKPTHGEVVVHGIHITQSGFKKIYQLRRKTGIVSPDFKLLRDRTVNGNVAFASEVIGQDRREDDSILALSAGEQQRVAIARALVNSPPLILADEPTGNLDTQTTFDVMEMFRDLHRKGTTIVLATQDTGLIRHYPNRVIHLLDGKKVECDTV